MMAMQTIQIGACCWLAKHLVWPHLAAPGMLLLFAWDRTWYQATMTCSPEPLNVARQAAGQDPGPYIEAGPAEEETDMVMLMIV